MFEPHVIGFDGQVSSTHGDQSPLERTCPPTCMFRWFIRVVIRRVYPLLGVLGKEGS